MELQSALIGAFVSIAAMTGMLLRRKRRSSDIIFSIVCVILSIWFFVALLRANFGHEPWFRIEVAIGAVFPVALIRLFADITPWNGPRARKLLNATYPLSAISTPIAASPLGNMPVVQVLIGLYIALIIILAFSGHATSARHRKRNRRVCA